MEWWHKMVFPVRRVWVALASRVKSRKNGESLTLSLPPPLSLSLSLSLSLYLCFKERERKHSPAKVIMNLSAGLLKLRDDIQTCGYEDVQVMWEMLSRSGLDSMSNLPKRKHRPFWRVFVWSGHSAAPSSFSTTHA
ncbi:hypothetical protein LOK49_LG04G02396 [Camellia lanceoleosa]|uniref:Uncharacterized protein n=1 Tax=Camellia lanceoleosa TaxID=1840588 RepID=A0ACC0HUE7_9ERIC|nr:hypothetical protein LOK49_LG04G02396 [Camellia lanceoleosa]